MENSFFNKKAWFQFVLKILLNILKIEDIQKHTVITTLESMTKIITSKLLLRLKTILKQGIYLRYSLHQKLKISSGISRLL